MCSRFTREYTWSDIHRLLDLRMPSPEEMADLAPGPDAPVALESGEIRPSYNVAPTQPGVVVHNRCDDEITGSPRVSTHCPRVRRWGLVPRWAKDLAIGQRTINARAETAAEKPAFRDAFARRRCVVPMSAFYEWADPGAGNRKQPHRIIRADGNPLLVAGLYERRRDDLPEGSFCVITTAANDTIRPLHDRMPVILEPEDARAWLAPEADPGEIGSLLRPCADDLLEHFPVSTRVNNPRNNDPSFRERVDPTQHPATPDSGDAQGTLFGP